jgi:hypothetical protein
VDFCRIQCFTENGLHIISIQKDNNTTNIYEIGRDVTNMDEVRRDATNADGTKRNATNTDGTGRDATRASYTKNMHYKIYHNLKSCMLC